MCYAGRPVPWCTGRLRADAHLPEAVAAARPSAADAARASARVDRGRAGRPIGASVRVDQPGQAAWVGFHLPGTLHRTMRASSACYFVLPQQAAIADSISASVPCPNKWSQPSEKSRSASHSVLHVQKPLANVQVHKAKLLGRPAAGGGRWWRRSSGAPEQELAPASLAAAQALQAKDAPKDGVVAVKVSSCILEDANGPYTIRSRDRAVHFVCAVTNLKKNAVWRRNMYCFCRRSSIRTRWRRCRWT